MIRSNRGLFGSRFGTFGAVFMALLMCMTMVIGFAAQAQDADNDGIQDSNEQALAAKFAPILYFHPDEKMHPVSPTYFLENSVLKSAHNATGTNNNPTVADISVLTNPDDAYYLDNQLGSISDDGIVDDFVANKASLQPTVHSRVVSNPSGGYFVQYWFFYPFNYGPMNTHEGDWEMITVIVDSGENPTSVGYSQHMDGAKATWDLVDKTSTNPHVYVALGAHANYLRPFMGGMGMANDECSDQGKVLKPADYTLVMLGEKGAGNHPADQGWLDFAGHWGEYGSMENEFRGERGPQGPAYFEDGNRWNDVGGWVDGLKVATEENFQINESMYNMVTYILLYFALMLLIRILIIFRRKKKQGTLGPRVLPFLYLGGGTKKTIGIILAIAGLAVAIYGIFLPWYAVTINVDTIVTSTQGEVDFLVIDGVKGIQMNMLSDNGVQQMFGLPIPFSLLLISGLALFFLSTVGILECKKFGKKLAFRGIRVLLPVIFILGFVGLLFGSLSAAIASDSPELERIMSAISSNPVGGTYTENFSGLGTLTLTWGLGMGAYMFIVAFILMFIGGILVASHGGVLDPRIQLPAGEPSGTEAEQYPGQEGYPQQAYGPDGQPLYDENGQPVYEQAAQPQYDQSGQPSQQPPPPEGYPPADGQQPGQDYQQPPPPAVDGQAPPPQEGQQVQPTPDESGQAPPPETRSGTESDDAQDDDDPPPPPPPPED